MVDRGILFNIAFSPDGSQIIATIYSTHIRDSNRTRLWDTEIGREIWTFTGHSSTTTSVAVSSDGNQIISGSSDYTIRLWDTGTGQ